MRTVVLLIGELLSTEEGWEEEEVFSEQVIS
jgi:hypothetical protein